MCDNKTIQTVTRLVGISKDSAVYVKCHVNEMFQIKNFG